jgi:uncharacterized protein YndB with AHSA1/START domain
MAEDIAVSTRVEAPASKVYELLSDLTRMGEWSPETRRVKWLGGATGPSVGAKFRGYNRHGPIWWFTTSTIAVAEPGKELAWEVTTAGQPIARWTYRFADDGSGGCTVTEAWEDKRWMPGKVLGLLTAVKDRAAHNKRGMEQTLRRLKDAVEAEVRH